MKKLVTVLLATTILTGCAGFNMRCEAVYETEEWKGAKSEQSTKPVGSILRR